MKKVLLALSLGLVAMSCGNSNKNSNDNSQVETKQVSSDKFSTTYISDKPVIEGGMYKKGLISSSQFQGILNPNLYTVDTDWQAILPLITDFVYYNDDFQVEKGGMADLTFNPKENSFTYTLRKGLKWSDGKPFTVDDIIYTYKLIGSPDYTGVRYGSKYANIIGMEDYHSGKTKEIKGLIKKSDTVLTVKTKSLSPNVIVMGGAVVGFISPYHYLKDVPIKDLEKSDKIRLKPLSYGPFKIEQVIPGESIKYVPNPYYWDKKAMPKVDSFILKILPTASAVASIKSGEFDYYQGFPVSVYDNVKNLNNIVLLGIPASYYSYLGFNLGHYDEKKEMNVYEPTKKMANLNLRKAMRYALNMKEITDVFYNGLRTPANGVVPPLYEKYYDKNIGDYSFNPEKAKQLLDEAGYKDINGDGYREDRNGKPLVITLLMASGSDIVEPISSAFIQYWKAVGLHVELVNGRLQDPNNFYDIVESNKGYDVFVAAWGVGTSLDMSGIYSDRARFNFPRYSTPENDKLLADLSNKKYIENPEGRIEAFKKWHKYYMDNLLGYAPLTFRTDITPVNKRVKEASVTNGSKTNGNSFPLAVTEKESYKAY